jgi:hypothetical protein
MKAECPVCGVVELVQVRGNSERIQHYVGFKDGKRVYLYHKGRRMEVTDGRSGSKLLEVNKAENGIFLGKEAPPVGLGPTTDWLTASRSTELSYGGTCDRT